MRFFLRAACCLALAAAAAARAVEATWIYSVQLSATVDAAAGRVTLNWPADHVPAQGYTIYRKAPGDAAWGDGVDLGGHETSFTQEGLAPGASYEYQVVKKGENFTGYGYLVAALNAPLVDQRGKLILVVDASIAGPLANELTRLHYDLAGDGWTVIRRDVARDARPADVRALIKADYEADRERVKAVLLFGRVPIARAGNLNIDGHQARPMPADVFYGEMDGAWTDADGDGILDQSHLPSDVELMVGRVDFAELPGTHAATQPYPGEIDLLRRYLNKNHAYRHARVRPALRALVGNQVGDGNGQAYAAAAYRAFAATVGADKVLTAASELDMPDNERWVSRLAKDDWLWAFGSGAGSDLSVGSIGTHGQWRDFWATDFVDLKLKGTFYLFFGSWFGDWSQPENVLRSALAAPDYGLAAAWSGRPHVFFHATGAGETLGYAIRASQNNDGKLYQNQVQRHNRGIHVALLGDPTLRLYMVAPPTEGSATAAGNDVAIAWKASPDTVVGYHVYRAPTPAGPFTRLTESPIPDTRFFDANRAGESATYLVRAIALQASPSGTFFNASQGEFAGYTATGTASPSTPATDTVWLDDTLPPGAIPYSSDNDRWNWIGGEPTPFSGQLAHRSEIAAGLHHHFFAFAAAPLAVNAGDTLYAYVYLDPANPPRAIMLTWLAGGHWEHRAYWGDNVFTEGLDGGPGRKRLGALPPAGRWVRLEVPAGAVGLEGQSATGMGFTLFDGRATWDRAGKLGR